MSIQYYCNNCNNIFSQSDLHSIRMLFDNRQSREIHWCRECSLKRGLLENDLHKGYVNNTWGERFEELMQEFIDECISANMP